MEYHRSQNSIIHHHTRGFLSGIRGFFCNYRIYFGSFFDIVISVFHFALVVTRAVVFQHTTAPMRGGPSQEPSHDLKNTFHHALSTIPTPSRFPQDGCLSSRNVQGSASANSTAKHEKKQYRKPQPMPGCRTIGSCDRAEKNWQTKPVWPGMPSPKSEQADESQPHSTSMTFLPIIVSGVETSESSSSPNKITLGMMFSLKIAM